MRPQYRVTLLEQTDDVIIITPVHEQKMILSQDDDLFGRTVHPPVTPRPINSLNQPNIIGFVGLTLTKAKFKSDLKHINQQILFALWVGILLFALLLLFWLRSTHSTDHSLGAGDVRSGNHQALPPS